MVRHPGVIDILLVKLRQLSTGFQFSKRIHTDSYPFTYGVFSSRPKIIIRKGKVFID